MNNYNDTKSYFITLETLKALVGLKRTVLFNLYRDYNTWLSTMIGDGIVEDAKAVTEYAIANGVNGVVIDGLTPSLVSYYLIQLLIGFKFIFLFMYSYNLCQYCLYYL